MRRKEAEQEAELRSQEAEQNVSLEIRMQTEIERIHVETEQWKKDKEFERMKNVVDAVIHYKEKLTELQSNTINTIGNMSIDLRRKANDLISSKIQEYKSFQDQAQRDAENDFLRIEEKFSNNEQIKNIMIGITSQKIANYVNTIAQLIAGLNKDIEDMKRNIDMLTQSGQTFINKQIEQFNQFNTISLPNENGNVKRIQ
ncbi:MAG TPA: hypothetical protein DDY68_00225 [Porphyromonadaceae bacterium]|nr:hypothetical protein [Porphyromonadaceae bacterium]